MIPESTLVRVGSVDILMRLSSVKNRAFVRYGFGLLSLPRLYRFLRTDLRCLLLFINHASVTTIYKQANVTNLGKSFKASLLLRVVLVGPITSDWI